MNGLRSYAPTHWRFIFIDGADDREPEQVGGQQRRGRKGALWDHPLLLVAQL